MKRWIKRKTTGPGRRYKYIVLIFGLIAFPVIISTVLIFHPLIFHQGNVPLKKSFAKSKDSALEQQIDIQAANMVTTSPTYTDATGSGFFLWNSARFSSLRHVYFEAGIAKSGTDSTTQRIRSDDIKANLVNGTMYKVRIQYGCSYDSTNNTFNEMGYAELWSADNATEVTSSAVDNTISSGSGTCPKKPTAVAVRFSRLIILQSNPNPITDTNTTINIGHMETLTLSDTNDHALNYPKLWQFTDHTRHPMSGWDSVKDILFSATLASPDRSSVSACFYDRTSNRELTCVSTSSSTPVYVISRNVTGLLNDQDQYETYLKVAHANTSVTLYNSFVTVEQSNPNGLSSMELYDDFNPYPFTSSAQNSFARSFFPNFWQPINFNLQISQLVPSSSEVLSFHMETTEETNSATTASTILFNTCMPYDLCAGNKGTVFNSNMDTGNTTSTRVRTADNAYPMMGGNELDAAVGLQGIAGTATSNVTWMILNVHPISTYAVQLTRNLSYGPEALETFDQCLPIGAPSNRPGLIVIHGGGWVTGDKSYDQFVALCNIYAAEGYVVDNINYRLAATPSGSADWPDQIGDVQLAVRKMRLNASQTGLDPRRICAYGNSSGAQLALLLDELQTIHPTDVAKISATFSSRVNCVVDPFGPTDLAKLYNENPPIRQTNISPLLDQQTPTSDPAIYSDASPLDNITPHTGPVLMIQGTQDQTVLPDQAQEMQQALQAAGIPYNLLWYVGDHGYQNLSQGQEDMIHEQINAWLVAQEYP